MINDSKGLEVMNSGTHHFWHSKRTQYDTMVGACHYVFVHTIEYVTKMQ